MTPKEYLDKQFASGKPRYCWMCNCSLTRLTATCDHLKPKSKGGRNTQANFALACKPCNNARGNTDLPLAVREAIKGRPAPKKRDLTALAEAIKRNSPRKKAPT